jgi:ferredoxin-like protein FixX
VKACLPPAGNGSLRLEIRYDRCVECNECAIQIACPDYAIVRLDVPGVAPASHHMSALHE